MTTVTNSPADDKPETPTTDPASTAVPAADEKPKRTKRARTARTKRLTDAALKAKLDEVWAGIGGGLMLFDPFCATTLVTNGPQVSDALIEIGKVNPRVRRTLESFAEVSTWGALMGAAGSVLLPILAHHGIIPGGIGVFLAPTDELRAAVGKEKAEEILAAMIAGHNGHRDHTDEPSEPAQPDLTVVE